MTYAIESLSERTVSCGRDLDESPLYPLEIIECLMLTAAFMLNECRNITLFKQTAELLAGDDPELVQECQRLSDDLDYVEHHIMFLKDLAPKERRRSEMLAAAKALKACAEALPEHAKLLRRVAGEMERWWSRPTN